LGFVKKPMQCYNNSMSLQHILNWTQITLFAKNNHPAPKLNHNYPNLVVKKILCPKDTMPCQIIC
jgi:hypothetical protein